MKAKVIKTGEIVDVYHEPQHGQITNIYKESVLVNGRMWTEDELDFCVKTSEAPEKISDFEMALTEMIDKAQQCVIEPIVVAQQWKDYLIELAKSEEPMSGLDNGNMPIERWKQAVVAASNQRSYRSSKGLTETKDDYFVDGVQWADEHPKDEPVSEELEKIVEEITEPTILNAYGTKELARRLRNTVIYGTSVSEELDEVAELYTLDDSVKPWRNLTKEAFKAGANWQKLQDMGITNKAQDVVANVLSSADNPLDAYATEVAFIMLPATLKESYHQTNRDRIGDAVRLGAKWQKEQFEKDYTNLCNGIATAKGLAVAMAYDKGMADAREQMMAKAVDVEVKVDAGDYPYIPQMELYDYDNDVPLAKEGDKYKVVLIKEE